VALMPVADALAAILAGAEPLAEEMIAFDEAFHRVLARDVAALRTQPPQRCRRWTAMRARRRRREIQARREGDRRSRGRRPFGQPIGPGEAVRSFTGGVVPMAPTPS